jgi:hypothetical protein
MGSNICRRLKFWWFLIDDSPGDYTRFTSFGLGSSLSRSIFYRLLPVLRRLIFNYEFDFMMIDFFRLEPAMINQTRLEPRLNDRCQKSPGEWVQTFADD